MKYHLPKPHPFLSSQPLLFIAWLGGQIIERGVAPEGGLLLTRAHSVLNIRGGDGDE